MVSPQAKRAEVSHQIAATSFELQENYNASAEKPHQKFADWMNHEMRVVGIPLSGFYAGGRDGWMVGFCFAKKEATLAAARERLRKL